MTKQLRSSHINFIITDTEKRGEVIEDDIAFFAAIYSTTVIKNGKSKEVTYSAAEKVMKGYRAIPQT